MIAYTYQGDKVDTFDRITGHKLIWRRAWRQWRQMAPIGSSLVGNGIPVVPDRLAEHIPGFWALVLTTIEVLKYFWFTNYFFR